MEEQSMSHHAGVAKQTETTMHICKPGIARLQRRLISEEGEDRHRQVILEWDTLGGEAGINWRRSWNQLEETNHICSRR